MGSSNSATNGDKMNFKYLGIDDEWRPVNQIEDNLYLGNSFAAIDSDIIKDLDIKCILSVFTQELEKKYNFISYMKIAIEDWYMADILSEITSANKFIADAQKSGKNVLVHCAAGISRSSAFVIAFIMNKYKMSYESARLLVRERRPIIYPNIGFAQQLRLYEIMGFTVDNAANNRELRQYLIQKYLHRENPWYETPNNITNYYKNIEVYESMAQNLDLGQTYLCANCGFKLFNEINIIADNESPTQESDQKSLCEWTYIEPQKWMTQLTEEFPEMTDCLVKCPECKAELIEFNKKFSQYECECPKHTIYDKTLRFRISNEKFKIQTK